jgi:hypothetical protein
MPMTSDRVSNICCRKIEHADVPAVVELLTRWPGRTKEYWFRALTQLSARPALGKYPRYGYMLDHHGAPVGVILLIFSRQRMQADAPVRCNISSWYVDPPYRGYASLLIAAAVRHKEVTYVNMSPGIHTWPILEAQGFKRYCDGQFLALPALSARVPHVAVSGFDPSDDYRDVLSADERELLTFHAEHGCLALLAVERGAVEPFIFQPRHLLRRHFPALPLVYFPGLPALHLVYCRGVDGFIRLAGSLGRTLLNRGWPLVVVDASAPLPGLYGKYFANWGPKYFKGPHPPKTGDLAYCEWVLFGP